MFGVANRRNNIALAGKLASNHLSQAIANTTKYSPNAGEIVMQGMEAKNYKEIAKINNEAQRDYYATTGQAKIDGFNDLNAATEKAEGQQRMAGMLAGIGALSYEFTRPKIKPPKPPERQSADMSGVQSELSDQLANLQSQLKDLKSGINDTDEKPTSSSGTVTDTSTSSTTQPLESATTVKPFKVEGFDDLDHQAFNALMSVEGGPAKFDAVNQGGKDDGYGIPDWAYSGAFSGMKQHGGRKLTDLSLSEIMELQRDPGKGVMSNQQWADAGKLHAVGAYQFIGPTLKAEVTAMGLDPSTKFTPQVQMQIAKSHAKRVGGLKEGTWRGIKNMTAAQKAIINQWNARL